MDFTLYTDFTCAECYVLNEYLASFGMGAAVLWKGVQLEPALPDMMTKLDRRSLARLEDEIDEAKRRAGDLEVTLPRGKPNSRRAIVALASVIRTHPSRAPAFRNALYRAYWRNGTDLSLPAELQHIADGAGVPRLVELDHPDAVEMADEWELDWATERLGGVPRVIRGDGKILWGLKPAAELAAFFLKESGS
ncbi:MAG TPA: DsbA family protein [Gemmatimonadaceae bacterium]|nr:DsbA family protein [Gemmatimonadaceae bacterium]